MITYFTSFIYGWIGLAIFIFFILLFITAPYGRHTTKTWGPLIDNRSAWIIMEIFVLIVINYFVFTGRLVQTPVNYIILGLFSLHYLNRSLIFPFRLRTSGKKMPVIVMLMGMTFNLANGFIIGYFLGNIKTYELEWLTTPQFIAGIIIFFTGMIVNWRADGILIRLRAPGEIGYKIPKGDMFRFVSCPNLLGEIIEWGGFCILTWSLPGLAFFIWTFANLVPRAISHHKWYKQRFNDYPPERRAVIPFVI
ncbi:MAG: 3-oxo-5-alpha-steroid 4-dehydrogenase [Saprospiraceae bacterium]|jgi:hypothetical protein|nr:3-oxo-5-alpha-steroid 4-dehydrogenase [Candidatus Parvibacillus calidus]MBX2936372.1 3-oxo-5-alpha-steroid 4-dehydrogenase [Saprospiraceae bacterium]MBX7180290.1 3-oxo-5-alpha-steroid 4-dehydrogenase [Saprospiraceae bacterium]MCB0590237.1 3-oxo-5-alpha-steroid 4-dehydrogenase [Saprospiraceae bacterium]MCO5283133.1 hypothetical protein [Saprospiraceae bacterium]